MNTVQLSNAYIHPERHNTQRYRRTDGWTDGQTASYQEPIILRAAVRSANKMQSTGII